MPWKKSKIKLKIEKNITDYCVVIVVQLFYGTYFTNNSD